MTLASHKYRVSVLRRGKLFFSPIGVWSLEALKSIGRDEAPNLMTRYYWGPVGCRWTGVHSNYNEDFSHRSGLHPGDRRSSHERKDVPCPGQGVGRCSRELQEAQSGTCAV